MIIHNANINGKIQNIMIENGRITRITADPIGRGIDAAGHPVIPGLIDVHTHGCMGFDTMDANFAPMCKFYAAHGTTSFLPTTMTLDYDSLKNVTEAEICWEGANILGFHFEGPYISKKRKGAQNEAFIKNPSLSDFAQFANVKMITVAPELPGSMEFIRAVVPQTIVSLGHTDCDYDTAMEAIANGANCLTHTFNAMPPIHHRDPGPIGAAVEKQIYAQIICDGFHVAKPVILAAYRMFGPERMVLISDSIRPAGLPDGEYESGGLPVMVKEGAIRLTDGTIAGSCATLLDCVKKAVEFGIPKEDAVRMASQTPAELLGVKKGKIEVGYDADLLIVDEQFHLLSVIIGGEEISNPREN